MFLWRPAGDEGEHLGSVMAIPSVVTFSEDRDARLEVGREHVGDQPPLEARTQPFLEVAISFGGRSDEMTIRRPAS